MAFNIYLNSAILPALDEHAYRLSTARHRGLVPTPTATTSRGGANSGTLASCAHAEVRAANGHSFFFFFMPPDAADPSKPIRRKRGAPPGPRLTEQPAIACSATWLKSPANPLGAMWATQIPFDPG